MKEFMTTPNFYFIIGLFGYYALVATTAWIVTYVRYKFYKRIRTQNILERRKQARVINYNTITTQRRQKCYDHKIYSTATRRVG